MDEFYGMCIILQQSSLKKQSYAKYKYLLHCYLQQWKIGEKSINAYTIPHPLNRT